MSEPVHPDEMRVSDLDRRSTQERLRRAHDAGQLDLTEFDERVAAVWAARTRAELASSTADLAETAPAPAGRRVFSDSGGGTAMRVLTIIWACLSSVALVSWGVVALSADDDVDPWWLWVAGPSAAVLLVLYVAGIGRPPRLQ